MKIIPRVIVLSVLCVTFVTENAFGQSPEDILRQSVLLENVPCYKADFELVQSSAGPAGKSHGIIYGESKADKSTCQRRESVVEFKGVRIETVMIINDGKAYQVLPGGKSAIEAPAATQTDPVAVFLSDPANYELSLRSERADGRKYLVLDVTLLEPVLQLERNTAQQAAKLLNVKAPVPIIASQERWIDADSHIVCQILTYDESRQLFSKVKYSNITTNVNLSENMFRVDPSVSIISAPNNPKEMSGFIKQSLGKLAGGSTSDQSSGENTKYVRITILAILSVQVLGALVWFIVRKKRKRHSG